LFGGKVLPAEGALIVILCHSSSAAALPLTIFITIHGHQQLAVEQHGVTMHPIVLIKNMEWHGAGKSSYEKIRRVEICGATQA
jgi:hypothetical protein